MKSIKRSRLMDQNWSQPLTLISYYLIFSGEGNMKNPREAGDLTLCTPSMLGWETKGIAAAGWQILSCTRSSSGVVDRSKSIPEQFKVLGAPNLGQPVEGGSHQVVTCLRVEAYLHNDIVMTSSTQGVLNEGIMLWAKMEVLIMASRWILRV
jgi:hypothetical protein